MLSKNQLTGWPTEKDPTPATAIRTKGGRLNGFPKADDENVAPGVARVDRTNPEIEVGLNVAEKARESLATAREVRRLRLKMFKCFEVERPVRSPDKSGKLYSPTCKEAGCRRKYYDSEDEFAQHVMDAHSSLEKRLAWQQAQESEELEAT